jgi:type II secretory ATPase GspE/PulE/Tfp pilus assembly ATPase PilB-like protein
LTARLLRDDWLLPTLEALLSPDQMDLVRSSAQESYWEVAVRRGLVSEDEVLTALASRFRMKVANVSLVSQQARELVPEQLARRYRVLPLAISDSVLDVATADPHDLDAERTLAFATGRTVRLSLASPLRIAERIDEVYRPENAVEKILQGVTSSHDIQSLAETEDSADIDIAGDKANERPIIKLVDHILAEGITSRASDIHLEPEESGFAVRYRIDGVLRQVMTLPRAAGVPLVSRIKIIASMDIADRLRPQDGRARVMVNGNRVDLRVSTLPASQGEKVVIRILDSRGTMLSLESLGFTPHEMERIQTLLSMREGIILVTGPTGSGKTTTLYSALRKIQERGVNIVTIEDPVEYKLQGIVQVQVNEKAGLTFASALRSILRQDPNVILIGEIRDKETAQIAVQASLTGHLVFSTLHTIDAASSVTRLNDVGVESYKLAAAVKGVVAQRLLRRICPHCRELRTDTMPDRLQRWFPPGAAMYRAIGCSECSQTGYRGRLAVTEVLITTPELERRMAANESADRITDAAKEGGMRPLWEAGVHHVRAGVTDVDELLRVLEVPMDTPARQSPPDAAPPRRSSRATPRHSPVPTVRTSGAVSTPVHEEPAFQLIDGMDGPASGGRNGHRTVLLVEDEEPLRRVLKDLLEREGYHVVEASDGVHALDAIDRHAPDVVVLDLNLPRLDGYGVLSHLRARAATERLPVLVLTARGDEDSEERVFEFGADDFLTKPFRPRALSARLRSLLKRVG